MFSPGLSLSDKLSYIINVSEIEWIVPTRETVYFKIKFLHLNTGIFFVSQVMPCLALSLYILQIES